jgi:hypothetical protein
MPHLVPKPRILSLGVDWRWPDPHDCCVEVVASDFVDSFLTKLIAII